MDQELPACAAPSSDTKRRHPDEAGLRPTRGAREVGHSTLMSNGILSNSLITIRVATLHPSLFKGEKFIVRAAANAEAWGHF